MMRILSYFIMGSYYRENIYRKMCDELSCDMILGEGRDGIKELDKTKLSGYKFTPKRMYLFKNICYDKGVIDFYIKGNYDILITGGDAYCLTVWWLLLVSKLRGKKVLMWTHGYYGRETTMTKWIKKIFFGLADRLLVYGDYAKNLLIENHIISADKIVVIYNSLNYDSQIGLRKSLSEEPIYRDHFKNNDKVIVFVGRLTKSKRLDYIIDVVGNLKEKNEHYNLALIGDGEDKDNLQQIVKEKGLQDSVWFYGACFDEKVLAELIYNADLCVSPGNVGLTAVHAMMFGTPVITHNNFPYQGPEFETIIPGETGAFFKQNDMESLRSEISRWFAAGKDRVTVRKTCMNLIDSKYNPAVQIQIMKKAIDSLDV